VIRRIEYLFMVNELSRAPRPLLATAGRHEGVRVDAHGRRVTPLCGIEFGGTIGRLAAGDQRNAEFE
jgi:hypothetical protein